MSDPIDPPPPSSPTTELRADVDRGLRFTHLMAMQTKRDVGALAARLFALLEELAERGQLDAASFDARRARLQIAEDERTVSRPHVQVAPAVDKYAITELPKIDCAARLPLCKARCCTLPFPLSFQDLDERVIAWDYARPYQIRQRADGYCTHCAPDTRQCQAYAQRPATCRSYDCREDSRIWLDFERRIPTPPATSSSPAAPSPEAAAPR